MLKYWLINNFKSFRGETNIELAPINVFAGANSSGKSTIIQSILLLKQTLQHAPANRALALNGPILKLGAFDDVCNSDADNKSIGFAWAFDIEPHQRRLRRPFSAHDPGFFMSYYWGMSRKNLATNAAFEVKFEAKGSKSELAHSASSYDELGQLQPHLTYSSIKITRQSEDATPHSEYLTISPVRHEDSGASSPSLVRAEETLRFDVKNIDDQTRADVIESKPDAHIVGATVQHFFPHYVAVSYDERKEKARNVSELICGDPSGRARLLREYSNLKLPSSIPKLIEEHFGPGITRQPTLMPIEGSEITLDALLELLRPLRRPTRSMIGTRSPTHVGTPTPTPATTLLELRPQIEQILLDIFVPKTVVDTTFPSNIHEAIGYANFFFSTAVRYLGPLRDEPKPIYPLEALANPTEVGYKGEHTAAVLDLHRDLEIEYIPSISVDAGSTEVSSRTATLHDAVVDWLSYVGVAQEVVTTDRGKIGHQLTVQAEDSSRLHDLTNVGVGVSQVLPIIVMALLAENPCLLIFEQPELHLHPKVQARLADFFLSVALQGKQCVLETHSEYMIERFRRRIAEANGDDLIKVVRIYFTERISGETKCRPVVVSKYGAISDWPLDFFDQAQIETEGILRAGKRKREIDKSGPVS